MQQKQQRQAPSKFESKTRRAGAHNRDVRRQEAQDQEWKRDVMDLFGYTKPQK